MSSKLPPKLLQSPGPRGTTFNRVPGVVINADATAVVRFLDIGTQVTPTGR